MKLGELLKLRRAEPMAAALLTVIYAVGLASHLIPTVRPLVIGLTPYILLICGLGVLALSLPTKGQRMNAETVSFVTWALVVTGATFGIEVLGVATGRIFGSYRYGEVLGFKLAGVPLVIGFNWTLVVLGASELSERLVGLVAKCRFGAHRLLLRTGSATAAFVEIPLTAVVTGVFAALFDLAMEPTAIRLGYWAWDNGSIPLRNYLAWFLLAAFSGLLYRALSPRRKRLSLPIAYFAVQLCFFFVLDFGLSGHLK